MITDSIVLHGIEAFDISDSVLYVTAIYELSDFILHAACSADGAM